MTKKIKFGDLLFRSKTLLTECISNIDKLRKEITIKKKFKKMVLKILLGLERAGHIK